jgi:hypothetical protein
MQALLLALFKHILINFTIFICIALNNSNAILKLLLCDNCHVDLSQLCLNELSGTYQVGKICLSICSLYINTVIYLMLL